MQIQPRAGEEHRTRPGGPRRRVGSRLRLSGFGKDCVTLIHHLPAGDRGNELASLRFTQRNHGPKQVNAVAIEPMAAIARPAIEVPKCFMSRSPLAQRSGCIQCDCTGPETKAKVSGSMCAERCPQAAFHSDPKRLYSPWIGRLQSRRSMFESI